MRSLGSIRWGLIGGFNVEVVVKVKPMAKARESDEEKSGDDQPTASDKEFIASEDDLEDNVRLWEEERLML